MPPPPAPILSQFNPVCAPPPKSNSWSSIWMLSSHLCLGLPSGLFPSGFASQNSVCNSPLPFIHATCPAPLILLDLITRIILGEEYRSLSSSLYNFLHSPVTSSLSDPPYSQTPSAYLRSSMWVTMFHTHTKQQDSYVYLNLYSFG